MPFTHVDPDSQAFLDQVASCDWQNPANVSELITSRHTPQAFRSELQRSYYGPGENSDSAGALDPNNVLGYWTGLFGTEQFPNGQGVSLKTEVYHVPQLQPSLARFKKLLQPTDYTDITRCNPCREELPTGGYSTMDIELFHHHIRTQPFCVENIKYIRDWVNYMDMVIADQKSFDTQIMHEFILAMVIRTAGNKILLESGHSGAGASNRNILPDYPMSYRDKYFPNVEDPDAIEPFDLSTAEELQFELTERGNTGGAVGFDPSGSPIFEFITSSDWYRNNVLRNQEYAEKVKYVMPQMLFRGFSLNSVDTYNGLRAKVMPWLPRFADSTTGGITIVPFHTNEAVEIGNEAISNADYRYAPYEIIYQVSPNQFNLLSHTPPGQSQGIPVESVISDRPWYAWNEYDKECNPEKNMPFWKRDYASGVAPKKPDESTLILARRQIFRKSPKNNCDVYDRLSVTPVTADCTIADCGQEIALQDSITSLDTVPTYAVVKRSIACGDPTFLILEVEHRDKLPEFVIAACGATVALNLSDGSTINGTVIDTSNVNPFRNYYIQIAELDALDDGVCVVSIEVADPGSDSNSASA